MASVSNYLVAWNEIQLLDTPHSDVKRGHTKEHFFIGLASHHHKMTGISVWKNDVIDNGRFDYSMSSVLIITFWSTKR